MITRVFRVQIDPAKKAEFEAKFEDVSIKAVEKQPGFLGVEIGRPTQWKPDEYVMISRWENEAALKEFVGDNWNEAHIPPGMDVFIKECWLDHFYDW